MQMFGIGIEELIVVFLLAAILIGPDRIPGFAADLARWIRQARAYAEHLTRDFHEVVADLENEVGASREDWQEIASVVGFHASSVTRELQNVSQLTRSLSLEPSPAAGPANVVPFEPGPPAQDSTAAAEVESPAEAEAAAPEEERPWYVPERSRRRRSAE